MSEYIDVLGMHLLCPNVSEAMEQIETYLQKGSLSTMGVITMHTLMQIPESPEWKQYVEGLDLPLIGETEVLQAAGVTSGQVWEQIEQNEFLTRIFWNLINRNERFFLVGETDEEVEELESYLRESFPDICIDGHVSGANSESVADDHIANEINGTFADIIICSLEGVAQERFLSENRQKINGKLWMNLGDIIVHKTEGSGRGNRIGNFFRKNAFLHLAEKFRD